MKIGVKKPEDCPLREKGDDRCKAFCAAAKRLPCEQLEYFPPECPLVNAGPILIEIEA